MLAPLADEAGRATRRGRRRRDALVGASLVAMRTGKLFHAIVIVGASLTAACGDGGSDDAGPGAGDAGEDAGGMIADAGDALDAGAPTDAGPEPDDAMVLIL